MPSREREVEELYYQINRMFEDLGFQEPYALQWDDFTTAGRTDVADYFEQSGIRSYAVLTHTPVLAFLCMSNRDDQEVRIIAKPDELLALPDHVKCMGQWQGKHRSDFFQFTVGQFREYLAQHPKQAHQRI